MNTLRALILMTVVAVLSGCSPTVAKLNKQHTFVMLQPRSIAKVPWAIDPAGFAASSSLEVLPVGGSDNDHGMGTRARADFHAVFEHNASALMTSLFGVGDKGVAKDKAEYVLKVRIGRVFTKMGMFAWDESQTEIELQFTLLRKGSGSVPTLPMISVTGKSSGNTGNLYTFHKNAHVRANTAINDAFEKAQSLLASALEQAPR